MISNITPKTKLNTNSNSKLLDYSIWVFAILCFTIVLVKVMYAIIMNSSLNLVSGSWLGLAMDLSDGVFYRPLYSESIGFGGTRFFPLYFSIHALLIKLSGMPIASGHFVSIFSGILLLIAYFMLYRQMKIELSLSFLLLSLLLSSFSIQLGIATIRADILPAALNVLGIVFILSDSKRKYNLILASIFFALAFSAKVTAVHGILSVFIWFVLTRRTKEALLVLLFTLIGYSLFFGVLYFGTSGRIIHIFKICASGGADFLTVLLAPKRLAINLIKGDPICLLLSLWILLVIYMNKKSLITNYFFIYWVVSIAITTFIFGSPGTNHNHLVDYAIASILLIGSTWNSIKLINNRYLFLISIVVAIVFNLFSLKLIFAGKESHLGIRYPQEIIDMIKQSDSEVLSENPMLPVIANKRPYILDPFMLRFILLNDEDIRSSALNSIANKRYSTIIFFNDPITNIEWYTKYHLGYEFVDCILLNYKVALRQGKYIVYVPNSSSSE